MYKLKLHLFKLAIGFLDKAYLRLNVDKQLVHSWVGTVIKRCDTRGTIDTIAWIKMVRLACTRYMCGAPLTASPGQGITLDKRGLPEGIPLVEMFVSRDPPRLRYALTLLNVSRMLPGWKNPDLAPITDPCPVVISHRLVEDVVGIVKELGWKLPLPRWEECHVTTKSGPNAQALIGSIEDAHNLSETQISNLGIVGGDALVQLIGTIRLISPLAWLAKFKGLSPKGRTARLSLVKDKEAKCRIVAILDYWTQSALQPLHKAQFALLRSLKSDCTFNQGSFRAALPQKGPYHSLDLSSATDRLPVSLQESVLAQLISPEYAAAWRSLICDRDYVYSWGERKGTDKTVRYACGQPMGAYSSWTTFAITHHALVRLAAVRAGNSAHWSKYVVLGDDVVIADDAVAEAYRAILSELGVPISEAKTHVSHDSYEFAKRWIVGGNEVTPAPLGSLFEAMRFAKKSEQDDLGVPTKAIRFISYYEIATWFRELEARWLPRSSTLVTRGLLAEFFTLFGQGGYSSRLADKAWRFFLLPSREDSRLLRAVKCEKLGSLLLGGILGCFAFRRSQTYVYLSINECKHKVLEEAIKRQMQTLHRFQLELSRFLDLVPEGMDAQSVLFALPPFAVLRQNISMLQLEWDKSQKARYSEDISQWLHLDVRLFLDPFAALSTRRNKTVASTKATVLNHLSAYAKGVADMRALAISEMELKSFVTVLNQFDPQPPRMRRRRKRAGGSPSKDA